MIKKEIGERIRAIRLSKGYSQEKFAPICGLNRTYIADVELGKRNISLENLNKIAEGLDMSLTELVDTNKAIQNTILLTIKGVNFILESKTELTREVKDTIIIIAESIYEEDEDDINDVLKSLNYDNIFELGAYQLAEVFEKVLKDKNNIEVKFKSIDLEVCIEENLGKEIF